MTDTGPKARALANRQAGMQFTNTGRVDLAAQYFRKALEDDANDGLTHALLAACLVDLHKPHEALDEAHEALRLSPRLSIGFMSLGSALSASGRHKEALAAFRELLDLMPRNPEVFASASFEMTRLGDAAGALAMAERGLALSPNDFGSLNSRALALIGLRRIAEARATLRDALVTAPQKSVLHQNLAVAFLQHGDTESARETLREALRLDPTNKAAADMLKTYAGSTGGAVFARIQRAGFWWGVQRGRRQALIIGAFLLATPLWPGFLTPASVLTLFALMRRAGRWKESRRPAVRVTGQVVSFAAPLLTILGFALPIFVTVASGSLSSVGGASFLAFMVLAVAEPTGTPHAIGLGGMVLMAGLGLFSRYVGAQELLLLPMIFGYMALAIPGGDNARAELPVYTGNPHPYSSPDERGWYG